MSKYDYTFKPGREPSAWLVLLVWLPVLAACGITY